MNPPIKQIAATHAVLPIIAPEVIAAQVLAKLQCRFAALAISNPNGFGDWIDEHFAIPDLAGAGSHGNCLGGLIGSRVRHNYFHFHLRQQVDVIFLAAIDLPVAFLPAVPANFSDGHTQNSDRNECVFDFFHFEWLDIGFDFLHVFFCLNIWQFDPGKGCRGAVYVAGKESNGNTIASLGDTPVHKTIATLYQAGKVEIFMRAI